MDVLGDLRLLLRSGHSLLVVSTAEEARCLELLRRALDGAPLWTWSTARGLALGDANPLYRSNEPAQLFGNLAELPGPWCAALLDPAVLLDDATSLRRLKELAQDARADQTVVLVGAELEIPNELDGLAFRWRLLPPSVDELAAMMDRLTGDLARRGLAVTLTPRDRVRVARSLSGLTMIEAERAVVREALADGEINGSDASSLLAAKAEILNTDGVLEIVDPGAVGLDGLGGLSELKRWLRARLDVEFERPEDAPRGVLLTGVPGCGKSAIARALAVDWSLPLLLLDPGRIYAKYIGESEERLASALGTVEAMAPAVLWIDEIEKGFASGGDGDGGVSARVLGTFLRWLQDRPPGIFVVATANDVTRLPPELGRKGRFDETFFVDLPTATEREEILRAQLTRRDVPAGSWNLGALAVTADGFSGAELEAAVVAASYRDPFDGEALEQEIRETVPLSRSREPEITALRAWAQDRTRPA